MSSRKKYNTRSSSKSDEIGEESPEVSTSTEPQKGKRKPTASSEKQISPTKSKRTQTKRKKSEKASRREEIIEKGHIYFFYRPKVNVEEVKGLQDVQRFYILLAPTTNVGEKYSEKAAASGVKRLLMMAKKELPDVVTHARFWAFVEKVSDKIEDIDEELSQKEYDTKTRGTQEKEGCRPIGEGVYALSHHKTHTNLSYVLELPAEVTEVQKEFNIQKEGSFIVMAKNPEIEGVTFLSSKNRPRYPKKLQELFKGKRVAETKFAPLEPPLLDYEGTELLMIGVAQNLEEELGDVGKEIEEMEAKEESKVNKDTLYNQLKLDKETHPVEPLTGRWK